MDGLTAATDQAEVVVPGPTPDHDGPVRIALVGGGVSVESLVPLLADALERPVDLRLAARDPARLAVVAGHCRELVRDRRHVTVTEASTVAGAVEGADVVVLMLRVGGLEARVADDDLARRWGIPGDEGLGPGGWANGLRTMPVIADLADELLRLAPAATVLDLVAPLGLTTRVLADRGVRAVGVCELPGVTARTLHAALRDDPVALAYAGYNHLGWFWPVGGDPGSVLDRVAEAGLADRAVVERVGAIPLKYYYWLFDPPAADRLGIARGADRSRALRDLRDDALDEMRARPGRTSSAATGRPTPWFDQALVPMVAALLGGPSWSGWADLPNRGLEPALASDHVVEVAVTVDAGGVRAAPSTDPVPGPVAAFLQRVGSTEGLLHQAWAEDRPELVDEAIRTGPHDVEPGRAVALARAVRHAAGWGSPTPSTRVRLPA